MIQSADERFVRYLRERMHTGSKRKIYPGLPAQPWYDAAQFPLVRYLESEHATIRSEIAALDPSRFHTEREEIPRTGDWDVLFFHEAGMRRDDACASCPSVAHAIDTFPVVTAPEGAVYASRLRAGSRVAPHVGPTNVRLRCHLGLDVPDGDCGIRVGDEVRTWQEGRCLVFDDSQEHEVWNNTDRDRTVLILDLWNPALDADEIRDLDALGRFLVREAKDLLGYWIRNADKGGSRSG